MMRTAPFNSRDVFYKSIFGSIKAGEKFKLSLLFPRDGYVKDAVAVFSKDGEKEFRFALTDDQNTLENNFYTRSGEIFLEEGLYFYHFEMDTNEGFRRLFNIGKGIGEFDPVGGTPWQLTVYDRDFAPPTHTMGGIIYQIFPDRFFKADIKAKIPADRFIREDWGGMPEFRQEDDKLTLGNDYFLGNLKGITEKLPYIQSLGVTMIYLNPIFEAHSNHRYNTADYFKIDPALGSENDFKELCKKAKKLGIEIILDGVFSHTGSDSVYFNKEGRYGKGGAYKDQNSPYRSWFKFKDDGKDYHSWWGVKTLPEVNEDDPGFTEFVTGESGVIRHWMQLGADGFRLDVADELPDGFLDAVRVAVKSANPNGYLLGEVWEDATNKISYDKRRRFLRGKQLDSVMNYPFANAIVNFICGGKGEDFCEQVMSVVENYPPAALHNLMNHIGTHDTPRILTRLAGEPARGRNRTWQSRQSLSGQGYKIGIKRLKLAAMLQFTLVGIPSIYYGDEVGMSGYGDPFCRGCFPWDNIDAELLCFYKKLGKVRRSCKAFTDGDIEFLSVGLGHIVYRRKKGNSSAIIGVNRWHEKEIIPLNIDLSKYKSVFGNKAENNALILGGEDAALLVLEGDDSAE